ncbi:hypothetical protein V8F33_008920 [Rhypophila sp. PSN 637]
MFGYGSPTGERQEHEAKIRHLAELNAGTLGGGARPLESSQTTTDQNSTRFLGGQYLAAESPGKDSRFQIKASACALIFSDGLHYSTVSVWPVMLVLTTHLCHPPGPSISTFSCISHILPQSRIKLLSHILFEKQPWSYGPICQTANQLQHADGSACNRNSGSVLASRFAGMQLDSIHSTLSRIRYLEQHESQISRPTPAEPYRSKLYHHQDNGWLAIFTSTSLIAQGRV